jgi:hypothetical protein
MVPHNRRGISRLFLQAKKLLRLIRLKVIVWLDCLSGY